MNSDIMNKVSGALKIVGHHLRQSKPEIALIVGCAGVLAGTVIACTKTKETVDTIEKTKEELRGAKDTVEEGTKEAAIIYSKIYGKMLYKLIKIYGVSALLWLGGLSSIIYSHVDLRKQNTKLLLDTVTLKKVFDEYRDRVKKEIGEDRESELYFDSKEEEVDIIEENPETGAKKITKKNAKTLNGNTGSKFARNFSERTSSEFDVRSYADYFLEERIKNLNKRLKIVPFLTINDVYDELGMKNGYGRCKEGMDWGWVWLPDNENAPNEIIVERLKGWEKFYDERENKEYYIPCLRIDFNCQPLLNYI